MNCPIALLVRIEASIKEAARMHLTDVAECLLDAKHALLKRVRERIMLRQVLFEGQGDDGFFGPALLGHAFLNGIVQSRVNLSPNETDLSVFARPPTVGFFLRHTQHRTRVLPVSPILV
jgi:hypothetical protein